MIDVSDQYKDNIIDALDSVTWYNGLAPYVRKWKKTIKKPFATPPDCYGADAFDGTTQAQLQVIWMMAVIMFGDYGTSPRTGWIEDIEGFQKFVDLITQTDQEAVDYAEGGGEDESR
jgi:hypothetical protein